MTSTLPAQSVRHQLEKILESSVFAQSERMCRFLRFVTEQALAGRSQDLKEYLLGVEVFDRSPSYDPRLDPIVRVEARRLRSKLKAYYEAEGQADEVIIELPTGSYAPRVQYRAAALSVSPQRQTAANNIAVLPLLNLSGDPDNQYLSDGLTEELIHRLTQVEGLQVVAWQSAARLREHQQDLALVREQLNASYILRGNVRRSGPRLRVMVQLVEAQAGRYLWSETYDRTIEDVVVIEQEIAWSVVQMLRRKLSLAPGTRGVERPLTANVSAYQWYLQGRFHWNKRTIDGLRRSIQCFTEALTADPAFPLAYAGLADSYSILGEYGLAAPNESMPMAREAARKALELDPMLGEAYTSLALIQAIYDWNWEESGQSYERAISLNPGYAQVHHWYATDYLIILGHFDKAQEELELALQLDPLSAIILEGRGMIPLLARRYDEAAHNYRKLIEFDPFFYKAYTGLGRAYAQMGRYDEAIAMLEKGRELGGGVPNIYSALGNVHGLAGHDAEARRLLYELGRLAESHHVPATCFALVHLGLGEHDNALNCLEAACQRRDMPLISLKVHPIYDPLRGDPRFQAILRRIGFLR